jgi:paired amphipathic helix protein Sin3a
MQQQNMQQALQGGGFRGGYRPAAPMRGGYGMPRHQKIVDMTKPPPQQQQRARKSQQQRSNAQNMSFAYNAGVEKQFFDQVKDTMTSSSRDGGAWAEFLKCLDMYSQEVLTRAEMLQLVEDLFGKHNDLFQEFKAILAASSSAEVIHDDTWYSVPLSEIDFSRCRKCTPSYRALPRDYPNPPCSERSDEEGKVLNNVWVSLPVGSEESYTFRHMRKNQYEEALFRCEDERFEIDMVLDANHSTLRVLEPLVEEISLLQQNEAALSGGGAVTPDGEDRAPVSQNGVGGARFQYKLDKRTLSVMHVTSILRCVNPNPFQPRPPAHPRIRSQYLRGRRAGDPGDDVSTGGAWRGGVLGSEALGRQRGAAARRLVLLRTPC